MTQPAVRERLGEGLSSAAIRAVTPAALALAAVGWWWSARMADDMAGSGSTGMDAMGATMAVGFLAFLVAWAAMMTAMMSPAVAPMVKLYGRAAAARRVAPLPFFAAGYLVVWTSMGVPAYAAWQALMDPIAAARPWTGQLAGAVLIAAAAWQLTPFKAACLRHCRSPISFFLRFGGKVTRPAGAVRMGAMHGVFCVGCCWALMAVLVAVGTMNLAWMAALALLIYVEKNASFGERAVTLVAPVLVALGVVLLVRPETLTTLT